MMVRRAVFLKKAKAGRSESGSLPYLFQTTFEIKSQNNAQPSTRHAPLVLRHLRNLDGGEQVFLGQNVVGRFKNQLTKERNRGSSGQCNAMIESEHKQADTSKLLLAPISQ